MTTYISKGYHGKYGRCQGITYSRNDQEYEYSYERCKATILVDDYNLKTATGLTPESSIDVLLPNKVQLPVSKKVVMHPSYRTITWEAPDIGCSKTELSDEHVEMFKGHVNVYKKPKVDSNNKYKDALITHFAKARSPYPLSFGFSLWQPVTICGIQAHQTKNQDISIIFLDQFQKPYQFAELIRPCLTNTRTVATGMHIVCVGGGSSSPPPPVRIGLPFLRRLR